MSNKNGLLSYNELVKLVDNGVINADTDNINGASIDITLHDTILIESAIKDNICLSAKANINMTEFKMANPFSITPNMFILASSHETFNLPSDIACEFKLKSSIARNGLDHCLAGWCDPCWNNSRLTLELKNVTTYHNLIIEAGMKIGQIIFYRVEPVPENKSYKVKGRYNNQEKATLSKGSETEK